MLNQLATYGCFVSGSTALTSPANGMFGDSGRNIFRGADFTNWDFSTSESTRFGRTRHASASRRVFQHPEPSELYRYQQ